MSGSGSGEEEGTRGGRDDSGGGGRGRRYSRRRQEQRGVRNSGTRGIQKEERGREWQKWSLLLLLLQGYASMRVNVGGAETQRCQNLWRRFAAFDHKADTLNDFGKLFPGDVFRVREAS